MKTEIEAKIEYKKIIGEANAGGYQPIRFTKVKYKAIPQTHIDIRQFQRATADDNGNDVFYPTKKGFRFSEVEFRKVIKEYALIPETYIHSRIIEKCFSLLNGKHFESAVLQAFKEIEISIREKIAAEPEDVGVKLIRRAFHPEKGPLANMNLPVSEREAFCNYIAGAFGFYKNPCSHRNVEMDYITAFDRIVVASDLLKTIDSSIVNNEFN